MAGRQYLRTEMRDSNAASNLSINERMKSAIAKGEQVYHLALGQAPFPLPEGLVKALLANGHQSAYENVRGIEQFRENIVKFHRRFPTGLDESLLNSENVITADGSKILIYLLMTLFDGVIILKSPAWTTYLPQTKLSGNKPVVKVNTTFSESYKINAENLEKAMENCEGQSKMMIFTNPCNPVGVVYSEEELREISVVCRKYEILVISDEIYGHLTYDGDFVSLSKFYPEGTIVTTGLSKWASAGGWRVGYCLIPPQLSAINSALHSAASHTYSCTAAPQQHAATQFLSSLEDCQTYMTHTNRVLKAVGLYCARKLRAAKVRVLDPQAGYYLFPDFSEFASQLQSRGIRTGKEMCDALLKGAKVALLPGGPDHLRSVSELSARLCFVNFDGGAAFKVSQDTPVDVELGDKFVNDYCRQTVEAIQAIIDWFTNL